MKKKNTLYYFFYIFKIIMIIIITIFITLDTVNTQIEKYMNISTKISPIYKEYTIGEPIIVTLNIKINNFKKFLFRHIYKFNFIDEKSPKKEKKMNNGISLSDGLGQIFSIITNGTYNKKIILNKFIKFRSIGEHNITGYYEIAFSTNKELKNIVVRKMTNNFKINLIAKNIKIFKKRLNKLYSKTLSHDVMERIFATRAITSLDNSEILPYLEKIIAQKSFSTSEIAIRRLLKRDINGMTPILKRIKNQIRWESLKKEISKSLGEE